MLYMDVHCSAAAGDTAESEAPNPLFLLPWSEFPAVILGVLPLNVSPLIPSHRRAGTILAPPE